MSQEPPPQPPLSYYPVPPKSGMTKGAKIALGVIVGSCVVIGGCFACATFVLDNRMKNLDTKSGAASRSAPTPTPPPSVTSSQYDALKDDMTFDEVVKMLGTRYEIKYESKDKTGSSGVYRWGNADDGFIILQFQNRKLYSKSQISLKH